MSYFQSLTDAMTMMAEHPKTLFVGQGVKYDGQRMHGSFSDVPMDRRIEMPVCEDMQMGFCTGLALEGFIPVCVYPRMDFLILAANQLVNHLDKMAQMSGYRPRVIIRTAVGSTKPLNPGPQHCQDYVQALSLMLTGTMVVSLPSAKLVVPAYKRALECAGPVLVVEYMDLY